MRLGRLAGTSGWRVALVLILAVAQVSTGARVVLAYHSGHVVWSRAANNERDCFGIHLSREFFAEGRANGSSRRIVLPSDRVGRPRRS